MKIIVIIPTYNEEENIKILVPLLEEKFKIFPKYSFTILFVDGNSKDDTVGAIKSMQKEYSNVDLIIEKEKSGLGGAYLKGFKYSMEELNADYVIEMDADLQHNPDDFPSLIEKISEGYDLIIGSRYIKGGSIPKEWALYRKFISYFGSLFARVVLGILKVRDFTSGFRVTKVEGVLNKLDFSKVKSKGFAYKMDMLVQINDLKAKIIEVPITFGLRDRGTSKMEDRNFKDSLNVVLQIAKERHKNFIKFMMVGFGGLFVDGIIFNIFSLQIEPHIAAIFSGFVAMLFTFLLNNFFSFKERRKSKSLDLLVYFLIYSISSLVPIFARGYIIYLFVFEFGDTLINRNIGFLIGIFLGLVWNYTVYSKIIWKKND